MARRSARCGKATELIASGAMKPAGLREVELAKADGRWDAAYDGQRTSSVPGARDLWGTLNSANRYAILYRIQDAKKPETRRIAKFMAMLEAGEKLYP
jgi:uncharacterized protein YdeI (YjbR/CyaY-like superfamily)